MTRQEMADKLDQVPVQDSGTMAEYGADVDVLKAAAAELRKSCAGCEHFWLRHFNPRTTDGICEKRNAFVPIDGSGFCHEWSAK